MVEKNNVRTKQAYWLRTYGHDDGLNLLASVAANESETLNPVTPKVDQSTQPLNRQGQKSPAASGPSILGQQPSPNFREEYPGGSQHEKMVSIPSTATFARAPKSVTPARFQQLLAAAASAANPTAPVGQKRPVVLNDHTHPTPEHVPPTPCSHALNFF